MVENAQNILVLATASTGNNVFCTPAIHLLRKHKPHAMIDVVVPNKLSAEVFENNPDINKTHVITKTRKFDALAKNYSQVIVLNKNALKKLPDIKTPYLLVTPLTENTHHAEQLMQFIAGWLKVEVTDDDRHYVLNTNQNAQVLLAKYALADDEVLINIHLGCGTTLLHGWKFFYSRRADDKKLWSLEAYVALGQALQARIPKLRILITGTSNESFLAKKFEKNVPNTINLVGKTTVSDLTAIMKRANLFIAHDCGVFHIAVASDVPVVALFGPTNPTFTGSYPLKPQHTLIKKESMADIQVDETVTAACQLLEKFPRQ